MEPKGAQGMRMYDLILKKRNGGALEKEEIIWMVEGYSKGEIPDYQMSAMMMAIYFKGLDKLETYHLTMAMAHSGDFLDLSHIQGQKVDKHSTGGVGDKTSLALGPIVASLGVSVAKMSGRGLGHTGGTIDKLESIPGFSTELTEKKFMSQIKDIQIAIMGQTKNLAPADKLLYALRDVTATVDQVSLIASSIMSKKLAAGADAIVLDVKTGNGAFMKREEDAIELARTMMEIGVQAGRKMTAVISNMDEPLGYAIGNALEVKEAVETLRGEGPEDFTELVYTLGAYMLISAGKVPNKEEGMCAIETAVKSGKAMEKFIQFVDAQGGHAEAIKDLSKLPKAEITEKVLAKSTGFVFKIETEEMGICSLILGGGRETKESVIDPAVGLVLRKKVGDFVHKGDILAVLHGNSAKKIQQAKEHFYKNYIISKERPKKKSIIQNVFFSEKTHKL